MKDTDIAVYFEGTILPENLSKSNIRDAIQVLRGESRAKSPFGKIQLMLYMDKFGDFFSKKGPTARVCKAIYESLSKDDQNSITEYLMHIEDDEDE